MRAVQYRAEGGGPEVVDIVVPEPGRGELLLKVTAAGLCHSDFVVMGRTEQQLGFSLPITLGHEGVGIVTALGADVDGWAVGDDVAVFGPAGCGTCTYCQQGKENYCSKARELGIFPPGLGAPGALAEYQLILNPRHLVPLKGLDPVQSVALTDAGLTPYHAIKPSISKLVPGSTAVVVGVGGLGHVAIQLLQALTPSRVIAVDLSSDKLELAKAVGADQALSAEAGVGAQIREITGGRGAEFVLDCVGADSTLAIARTIAAVDAHIAVVGAAGGTLPVGLGTLPFEASVSTSFWGTRGELLEVLELAHSGMIKVHTTTFRIDQTPEAYERLRQGTIAGRAVVLPPE
jgi:propanol-preferring alcohol dehydrogenase